MSLVIKLHAHRILHDVAIPLVEGGPVILHALDVNVILAGRQSCLLTFAIDVQEAHYGATGKVAHRFLASISRNESNHVAVLVLLFDGAIFDRLLVNFDPALLNIAVDRKLDSIFDFDDAMKVRTRKDRVTDVGKHLREFDAIDTGLFVCPLEIFDYLERAKSESGRNDCSLADGIRLMADDDKVRAIDIGESWWQDVDTAPMLDHAEKQIAKARMLSQQDALR